jgi:hypothetical protein
MLGMFSPYMCEWELKKRPSLAQNKVMQVANQKIEHTGSSQLEDFDWLE